MNNRIPRFAALTVTGAFLVVAVSLCLITCQPTQPPVTPPTLTPAPDIEPISAVGHGGFFDPKGQQIVPSEAFIVQAQAYYRSVLLKRLPAEKNAELPDFEKRLKSGLKLQGQSGLVVQQRVLDWLIANSPRQNGDSRMIGKIAALAYDLRWERPTGKDALSMAARQPFTLDQSVADRLTKPDFRMADITVLLATVNSGQAYVNECTTAGVPIPPPIGRLDPAGLTGWKSQGFIPPSNQFIVGTPAEVRTFESPQGMCIALPRYTNTSLSTVSLDGVICLSKTTSQVCFWDNQMGGNGFQFATGTQIPIGVPNTAINPAGQYQAGGAEIEFGSGGVCTDCHAGENPYIIHPDLNLNPTLKMGGLASVLPTFGPNRYVPIVGASWPQNDASLAASATPSVCAGCHRKGGNGRLPHLSNQLTGYCGTILPQALQKTMPRSSPGSTLNTPAINALLALCNASPTSSTADYGDPHLTTVNGVHYDFQAAGEFTALRNTDGDFEVQARQTPVSTSFTPGADPYTGLASCVSLNTAAAFRLGSHRISYQPTRGKPDSPGNLQLRVDGALVDLAAEGLDLGAGAKITKADAEGALDVRAADGTRVIITPSFWATEGYWFLNIDVLNTTAGDGVMGYIPPGSWLPPAPSGSSFGPLPASLGARHVVLNQTFANAWRVNDKTSLFDYLSGTSTANFTDRDWPPKPGDPCVAKIDAWGTPARGPRQAHELDPKTAQQLCRPVIDDKASFEDCVFDLITTGNEGFANAYGRSLKLRNAVH